MRFDELFMFWAMVNKCAVNIGYDLLSHLASVATQTTSKIVVGGVISFISEKFGAEVAPEENYIRGIMPLILILVLRCTRLGI